jgi:hypothetical protein
MRVNCIIVFHPAIDESESGTGIGYWADPEIMRLKVFTKASAIPLLSGLSTGVKHRVSAGRFTVHRRLWEVSTFDIATLARRPHRLHFPWQLMDVFLSKSNCEIEVRCREGYEAARDHVRLFQSMLYLGATTPFLLPFGSSHSMNAYSGINSRDSDALRQKLPEGRRDGLTSDAAVVEVWLHEPGLHCIAIPNLEKISDGSVFMANRYADVWRTSEKKYSHLKAVRLALHTAPMITDLSSSLLHLWQGIE